MISSLIWGSVLEKWKTTHTTRLEGVTWRPSACSQVWSLWPESEPGGREQGGGLRLQGRRAAGREGAMVAFTGRRECPPGRARGRLCGPLWRRQHRNASQAPGDCCCESLWAKPAVCVDLFSWLFRYRRPSVLGRVPPRGFKSTKKRSKRP